MNAIKKYSSLVKFSHTIFAMPFAGIGFLLGVKDSDVFSWNLLIYVLLCMVFARTAAMAFNRYIDRNIDKLNPRTAQREIPANLISPNSALFFVIINSIFFVIVTYFINKLCFYLSPVALLVVLGYSYAKRFTFLCHLILGVGLSLAPIGAYIAVTGSFNWLPIVFSLIVITWVSGFDIIYALQDAEFDKEHKLWSIPSVFGVNKALNISSILHICCALFLLYAGLLNNSSFWFWTGIILFVLLLIRQHILVKPNDLSKINMAFFTLNGLASVMLFIFFLLDFFIKK